MGTPERRADGAFDVADVAVADAVFHLDDLKPLVERVASVTLHCPEALRAGRS
jgi:hypothetical protein